MSNRLFTVLALMLGASRALAVPEDTLPPQIIHEPCEFYKKGQSYTIRAQFYDDSPLFDPKVVFRTQKVTEFRTLPFTKGDGSDFEAVIKAKDLKGPLEYFLETFDENGNGPARYGGPDAPVRVLPANDVVECVQTGETYTPMKTVDASTKSPDGGGSGAGSGDKAGGGPVVSDKGGGDRQGGASSRASPSGGNVVMEAPIPPAKEGCDADDAPAYCSPLLWTFVGIGVVGAAVGAGVGIYFATRPSDPPLPLPDRVSITISAGDATDAIP